MGDIITFLGEKLSKKINKELMPTKGFLRLAIKDQFGMDVKIKNLTYQDFKKVFQTTLKKRLKAIEVSNLDEIIEYLTNELKNNQSLLTMMSI